MVQAVSMTGTGIHGRGKRVVGSTTLAALLALAYSLVSSGASAAEAPDTVGSWPADCEGALVRGQAPTLIWAYLNDEVRKALLHPAFGLQILDEWRDKDFLALPLAQRSENYYGAWVGELHGNVSDQELVTHRVVMPTGVTFERVVFDQGRGTEIALPSGERILDPGFGGVGVSWKALWDTEALKPPLLWSPPIPGRYTYDKAEKLCAQWGGRLPTALEYEELVAHLGQYKDKKGGTRLHELMGFENAFYWSWSRDIFDPGVGYVMNGYSGQTSYSFRLSLNGAVRCVR